MDQQTQDALFEYLLRLGDDLLVLGHRLSEWCGHAPILEEDIALSNIALDCIGQAEAFLALAGETEGKGRDENKLAYFRDEWEYHNLALLEQPRGDFAYTIVRQFLYNTFSWIHLDALKDSKHEPLAAIAAKAHKEVTYHLRHASAWLQRLGDGTEESHNRMQKALDDLWMFTDELFYTDDVDKVLYEADMAPDLDAFRDQWREMVTSEITKATLTVPEDGYMAEGARQGRHTEHLGHMLAEMQILARSHPEATW